MPLHRFVHTLLTCRMWHKSWMSTNSNETRAGQSRMARHHILWLRQTDGSKRIMHPDELRLRKNLSVLCYLHFKWKCWAAAEYSGEKLLRADDFFKFNSLIVVNFRVTRPCHVHQLSIEIDSELVKIFNVITWPTKFPNIGMILRAGDSQAWPEYPNTKKA